MTIHRATLQHWRSEWAGRDTWTRFCHAWHFMGICAFRRFITS